jgi:endonuclease YncB( thermonuclease family)
MIRRVVLLVFALVGSAQAADVSGILRIVDGDTLAIGDIKIRLEGIDAPETDQVCKCSNSPSKSSLSEARPYWR